MLEVPFTGDRVLLTHSAGRAYEGLEADVAATHDAILAYYSTLDRDPAEFDRWWSRLEGMLVETVEWANAEAEVFNTRLGEFVVGQIAARRDRQRRNKDFIRRVGLERRDDALVLAPVVRRAVCRPGPATAGVQRPGSCSTVRSSTGSWTPCRRWAWRLSGPPRRSRGCARRSCATSCSWR